MRRLPEGNPIIAIAKRRILDVLFPPAQHVRRLSPDSGGAADGESHQAARDARPSRRQCRGAPRRR